MIFISLSYHFIVCIIFIICDDSSILSMIFHDFDQEIRSHGGGASSSSCNQEGQWGQTDGTMKNFGIYRELTGKISFASSSFAAMRATPSSVATFQDGCPSQAGA